MKKILSLIFAVAILANICAFAQNGAIYQITSENDSVINFLSDEAKAVIGQKLSEGGKVFYGTKTSNENSILSNTANSVVELPDGMGVFDLVLLGGERDDSPFWFDATEACKIKLWFNTLDDEEWYADSCEIEISLYCKDEAKFVCTKTAIAKSAQEIKTLNYTLKEGYRYQIYIRNLSSEECHISVLASGVAI